MNRILRTIERSSVVLVLRLYRIAKILSPSLPLSSRLYHHFVSRARKFERSALIIVARFVPLAHFSLFTEDNYYFSIFSLLYEAASIAKTTEKKKAAGRERYRRLLSKIFYSSFFYAEYTRREKKIPTTLSALTINIVTLSFFLIIIILIITIII